MMLKLLLPRREAEEKRAPPNRSPSGMFFWRKAVPGARRDRKLAQRYEATRNGQTSCLSTRRGASRMAAALFDRELYENTTCTCT
jgi:hypothetical protein